MIPRSERHQEQDTHAGEPLCQRCQPGLRGRVDPMEVFDLNDERVPSAAVQAQLHKYCQRAGMILLGTETGELLRLCSPSQQVEEIGSGRSRLQTDLLETLGHLRRHDCWTVAIGNAAGMPEEA